MFAERYEGLFVNDKITVNGELIPLFTTILFELLKENGVNGDKGGIAVALNGEVVPRGEWDQTVLKPMDKVEIVHIVRGG